MQHTFGEVKYSSQTVPRVQYVISILQTVENGKMQGSIMVTKLRQFYANWRRNSKKIHSTLLLKSWLSY